MVWLNAIFLRFYCLSIAGAVLAAAGAVLLFLLLRRQFDGRRGWTAGVACLLLVWLAAVLWVTVWSRGDGSAHDTILIPFYSYYTVLTGGNPELLRSNFMNVLLFLPAGLLLGSLLPRKWPLRVRLLWVGVLLAALSAGIELFQHIRCLGRAEIDDVFHNTLGALLGGWAAAAGRTHTIPES